MMRQARSGSVWRCKARRGAVWLGRRGEVVHGGLLQGPER